MVNRKKLLINHTQEITYNTNMTIEEMILELQKLKEKHGNVKLMLEDMYSLKPVDCLTIHQEYDDVKVVII